MKTHSFLLAVFAGLFLFPAVALVAQKSRTPAQEAKTAQEFYDEARNFENQKKYREAVDSYTVAIRLSPDHPLAYVGRGRAYNGLKDYRGAIKDYDTAIRIYSSWGPKKNRESSRGATIGELQAFEFFQTEVEMSPDDKSFQAEVEIGHVYFWRGAAKSSFGDKVGACEDFHESCKWWRGGCDASNVCERESVRVPIEPEAQEQSGALGVEPSVWEGIQADEVYSPGLDELLTRQFCCAFGGGNVSCKVRVTAGSKLAIVPYLDRRTNRVERRQERIPGRLLTWEDKIGTYQIKGNHIHIDLSTYSIEATVQGNNMEGEITLKLQSDQTVRWVAAKHSEGEQCFISN